MVLLGGGTGEYTLVSSVTSAYTLTMNNGMIVAQSKSSTGAQYGIITVINGVYNNAGGNPPFLIDDNGTLKVNTSVYNASQINDTKLHIYMDN